MWVQSLGWEDLEEEMATPSSFLAWRIPWTEEPVGLQSIGLQRVAELLSRLIVLSMTFNYKGSLYLLIWLLTKDIATL